VNIGDGRAKPKWTKGEADAFLASTVHMGVLNAALATTATIQRISIAIRVPLALERVLMQAPASHRLAVIA
jgi:hypothetical protein